jgi:hypothetical protein
MKLSIFLAIAIALSIFTFSCKKANQAPVISLNEPAANSTYISGDEVHIEGTTTDDYGLKNGYLSVIKTADSSILFNYALSDAATKTSYYFHQHYIPTVIASTPMKVYVVFEDKEGLKTSQKIDITVNP